MTNWFQNVGNHKESSLRSWEDWPGPEEPACEAVGNIAQELYEHLEKKYGLTYEQFNQKVDQVLNEIAKTHEWDKEQDCYDPRSAAAWEAAWWVSLNHYYIHYKLKVPETVAKMLVVLEAGHWPYALHENGEIQVF